MINDSGEGPGGVDLAGAFAPLARAAGLGVPPEVAFRPPEVFVGGEKSRPVPQKYIPQIVDALRGRHLLFRRGSDIVSWSGHEKRFKLMKPNSLVSWLPSPNGGGVVLVRETKPEVDGDGAKTGRVQTVVGDLSPTMAFNVLSSEDFLSALPEVVNINSVSLPVLDAELDERGNRRMRLCRRGYDERSKTWTLGDVSYDEHMDVRDGMMWLNELVQHFAWRDKNRDFAIWLAGLVTMFGRGMFGGRAPAFFVNANIQKSGKTLLAWLISHAVHGVRGEKVLDEDGEDELRKFLDSAAKAHKPFIIFDNIDWNGKEIKTPLLDVFIAGNTHEIRKMATQDIEEYINRTMVLGTGNNITLSKDLDRRSLMVDLWNPLAGNSRVLPKGLKLIDDDFWEDVKNRQMLLGTCWAMLREWDKTGRPQKPGELMGSFESWARFAPAVVWHVGGLFKQEWDCMKESGNEEIGDKKSRDFAKLAEWAVKEHCYDAEGKEKLKAEVLVRQMAGIARRHGLEGVQGYLWPETSIEAVLASKDFKAPVKKASTVPVDEVDWDAMEAGEAADPAALQAAAEFMSTKAAASFGVALKKQLHERHFRMGDGSVWSFRNMAGANPRRFGIEKVKGAEV